MELFPEKMTKFKFSSWGTSEIFVLKNLDDGMNEGVQ